VKKEMKYNYGPVAIMVWCDDCDWKTESYKNGQAIAKKHAQKHGHRVHGELTIAFAYDGRKEGEKT
jgi:hypothetical protein